MSSDEPRDAADPPKPRRSRRSIFLPLIVGVIVIDVLAFFLVPPYAGDARATRWLRSVT